MAPPRITLQTIKILQMFLRDPALPIAGSEIIAETGIFSGTLYPILTRLLAEKWLTDEWEDIDQAIEQRPAKRFYTITEFGLSEARTVLDGITEK